MDYWQRLLIYSALASLALLLLHAIIDARRPEMSLAHIISLAARAKPPEGKLYGTIAIAPTLHAAARRALHSDTARSLQTATTDTPLDRVARRQAFPLHYQPWQGKPRIKIISTKDVAIAALSTSGSSSEHLSVAAQEHAFSASPSTSVGTIANGLCRVSTRRLGRCRSKSPS